MVWLLILLYDNRDSVLVFSLLRQNREGHEYGRHCSSKTQKQAGNDLSSQVRWSGQKIQRPARYPSSHVVQDPVDFSAASCIQGSVKKGVKAAKAASAASSAQASGKFFICHLLLLLPFLLFDLLDDEIHNENEKNEGFALINPVHALIKLALLLLEWYQLYR
jgi:hypothetical protein